MTTIIQSNPAKLNEIKDLLKNNQIPQVNKKTRFKPIYAGTKGALGHINGFLANRHRLCGGTIIEATYSDMATDTGYCERTAQRIVKKLESMGRLIILKGWKNSYLYLPENVGIESWLENFKAKFGIDLRTQTVIESGQNVHNLDNENRGQNVHNIRTKCPEDDHFIEESFKESKDDPPEKPPFVPPPETDIDRIKNEVPKKCLYKIKNLDEKINSSIQKYSYEFTLWAAQQSHNGKFKDALFEDMITKGPEKYDLYEKQRTRDIEKKEIEESEAHKREIKFMAKIFPSDILQFQSLNTYTSDQNQPSNPKEDRAFKDQRDRFLDSIVWNPDLLKRFEFISENELKKTKEFINFCKKLGLNP